MTQRQIALVCAVAGLTLAGANLLIDAIATRIYNCNPDPYFSETCTEQDIAYLGIIVACWLVATYLIARREAIGPFACLIMGPMLWFESSSGSSFRPLPSSLRTTISSWAPSPASRASRLSACSSQCSCRPSSRLLSVTPCK